MKNVLSYFTDQFSGPGRAIGYYRFVMCVTVCADNKFRTKWSLTYVE